ncbi:uncharacterized protein LOC133781629 isoform X1 [Humulus lupulus]|uniref:uncharacterized protein LOC133781629 isoform X1 n=1 Tax=Humulus lupulus TaxID=3486 RepID=UPI002B4181AC|nr:uncharacterized protein LOC133781629 isoform X1 [Humulus lupulus]
MAEDDIAQKIAKLKQEMVGEIRGAMQRSWGEVVSLYEREPMTHMTKISRSGYTALHVAVADGNEDIVEKLVNRIKVVQEKTEPTNPNHIVEKSEILLTPVEDEYTMVETGEKLVMYSKPLEIKNQKGDTALHLAALIGNVRMCRAIITAASSDVKLAASLIEIENNMGETPLFLAALHGKKDAFLYLNSVLTNKAGSSKWAVRCCRRHNGDTVLHCAIDGEFFDLAFQIISLNEDLAKSVNGAGQAPLHILADKPCAFRSSINKLDLWRAIIYKFIYVEKLTTNVEPSETSLRSSDDGEQEQKKYPPNYFTLVRIFAYLWKFVVIVTTSRFSFEEETTTNNPNGGDKDSPRNSTAGTDIENQTYRGNQGNKSVPEMVPPNYVIIYNFLMLIHRSLLAFTGLGHGWIIGIRKLKEKHQWSVQLLNELLKHNILYDFEDAGEMPYFDVQNKKYYEELNLAFDQAKEESPNDQKSSTSEVVIRKRETPILIAARNGITEMVEIILKRFPMAIYDSNEDGKNIVLLALENKKVKLYKFLLQKFSKNESIFRRVDNNGNGALHVAAANNDHGNLHRWPIPGDALQMQWEIKWNMFVKNSMPEDFFVGYNNKGETPEAIFTRDHKSLVQTGSEWMRKTAESCSLVAALIATVAFATSTSLPGGTSDQNGKPMFAKQPAFHVFAVASLIALCFSVTSLVMFLAILTSRFSEKEFDKVLPRKLLLGLTSLFLAIVSMLVSFCAGHFFVLQDALKVAAFPVYTLTFIPISFFAAAQFPLYIDLVRATFWSPFGGQENYFH